MFLGFTEYFQIIAQSDPVRFQNLPLLIHDALAPSGPALSTVRSWFNQTGSMTLRHFPDVIRLMLHRGYDLSSLKNYLIQLFETRPRPRRSLDRLLRDALISLGRVHQLDLAAIEEANRVELGTAQQLANNLIDLGEIGRDLQQQLIEATSGHTPEDLTTIELNLPQERR
jgi:hypothetical protein